MRRAIDYARIGSELLRAREDEEKRETEKSKREGKKKRGNRLLTPSGLRGDMSEAEKMKRKKGNLAYSLTEWLGVR